MSEVVNGTTCLGGVLVNVTTCVLAHIRPLLTCKERGAAASRVACRQWVKGDVNWLKIGLLTPHIAFLQIFLLRNIILNARV